MIKFNDTFIIGIDHGYGNLKTANSVTSSGVKVYDYEPPFKKDVLEYDGKFICIGENHKFFVDDKTADYCSDILAALYNNEYNSKLMKLYVVGGGAIVMNNHNINPPNTTFITDICANAKGYEFQAKGYEFQAKRNLRKCADGKDNKSQT